MQLKSLLFGLIHIYLLLAQYEVNGDPLQYRGGSNGLAQYGDSYQGTEARFGAGGIWETGLEEVQDLPNGLVERGKQEVNSYIGPVKAYASVINRFRTWYQRYGSKKDNIREMLKIKYARVDDELAREICSANENPSEESLHSMDFVLEVLERLIDQLEEEELNEDEDDDSMDYTMEYDEEDERRSAQAMQRIKSTAAKLAKGAIRNEATAAASVVAWHGASMALTYFNLLPPNLSTVLTFIVGSAETSFVVKYLQNMAYRAILTASGPFNPENYMSCLFKSKKKSE